MGAQLPGPPPWWPEARASEARHYQTSIESRCGPVSCSALLAARGAEACCDSNDIRYYSPVIRTFADGDSEKVFRRERSRRLPPEVQRRAHRKLLLVHAAERIDDLKVPPGNRLERLKGDREGQHSIRINDRWRICFRWSGGDAFEVEITDYH
jgi:proteic killer suppression protein